MVAKIAGSKLWLVRKHFFTRGIDFIIDKISKTCKIIAKSKHIAGTAIVAPSTFSIKQSFFLTDTMYKQHLIF